MTSLLYEPLRTNVLTFYPAIIFLLKVNNRNTRTRLEIVNVCLIIILKFEHISHLVLGFLLLTLNM